MGFRRPNYVGLTLLFSEQRQGELFGVLKSYVRSCRTAQRAESLALAIGRREEASSAEATMYVGLEDIFRVSPPGHGALLGRATHTEWNTAAAVESRILPQEDQVWHRQDNLGPYFNARLAYFVERGRAAYSIVAIASVRAASPEEAVLRGHALGESADFKTLVAEDPEAPIDLSFVGIMDLARASGDASAAFECFEKRIGPKEDLEHMLLHPADLVDFFHAEG